jgi:hypothetical protein
MQFLFLSCSCERLSEIKGAVDEREGGEEEGEAEEEEVVVQSLSKFPEL